MFPVISLLPNSDLVNCVRFPIEDGMLPVKSLFSQRRVCKLTNSPMFSGICVSAILDELQLMVVVVSLSK